MFNYRCHENVCNFTNSLILNSRKKLVASNEIFFKHFNSRVSDYCLLETLDVLTARLSTKTVPISNENKILRDAKKNRS